VDTHNPQWQFTVGHIPTSVRDQNEGNCAGVGDTSITDIQTATGLPIVSFRSRRQATSQPCADGNDDNGCGRTLASCGEPVLPPTSRAFVQ
jgi:hypothetical protein